MQVGYWKFLATKRKYIAHRAISKSLFSVFCELLYVSYRYLCRFSFRYITSHACNQAPNTRPSLPIRAELLTNAQALDSCCRGNMAAPHVYSHRAYFFQKRIRRILRKYYLTPQHLLPSSLYHTSWVSNSATALDTVLLGLHPPP